MNRYVLDSFPLMAFFEKEHGWERIYELLQDASKGTTQLYISLINLAEVQYMIMRRRHNSAQVLAALASLPLVHASADKYMSQVVALKAYNAVSLADCFAAALALDLQCPVVTGDPGFRKLEQIVDVEWL